MPGVYGYVPSGAIHEEVKTGRFAILKRVLRLEMRYLPLILLSFALAVVSVIFTLLVPIRIGNAIDLVMAGTTTGAFRGLLIRAACYAGLAGFAQYGMNLINNHVVFHTAVKIRAHAFSRLQHFPISYLDSHPEGDLVSRLCADTEQLTDGLLLGFTQLFTGIVTILGTLIFMFSMNVTIALIVVVLTPLSLFVANFISKHTFEMFKKQSGERGEQTALIDEVLTNVKTVKAYGREEAVLAQFDEINERLADSSLRALFFSSLTNPSTRFVNNLIYALVACVGTIAVYSDATPLFGTLSVGILTAFLSYATQYMKPFNEITSVVTELQNAIACAARVFEVIDDESMEPECKDPKQMPSPSGSVMLSHVDFSYIKDRELIKDLNVDVKSGMKVAIVGPTGCGKTTLIN
ncbi:MAG: ABC transporter ATP-binding protein, partial [Lachnospiraceae bacterium]|nr:ABC transporter ATP-binding protein [Lachnospiraceae bacterium]